MTLAATSRQAYESLKERGALTDGQRKIMLWFHGQPKGSAYTRAQISQRAKFPLQSVCGRCNELVKLGYLEELSIVACPVTGNPAHQLRIPNTAAPAPVRAGESAIPQTDSPPLPSIAPPVAAARIVDGVWLEPGEILVGQHRASLSPGDGRFDYVAVTVGKA